MQVPLQLPLGPRVRASPYWDATVAAGLTAASVYNHMYMPVSYGDSMAEYWRLIDGVAMWDVAVQRQVEISGPDAAQLAQLVSARDLSTSKVGQGRYAPMCDYDGRLLNDPIALRVDKDRYWFSIADNDMVLWCQAIGRERGLDIHVHEPDVSPLAVQGPKAEDVVASLLGDWVRDIKFFWYAPAEINGIPLQVGRAGWSKQGGFELYLLDGSRGTELWNLVAEAGAPWDIGPGCPNYYERVESALLSYRADTDDETTPLEVGLGRYTSLDSDVDFIGKAALLAQREAGITRELVGLFIDGDDLGINARPWPAQVDGVDVGLVRVTAHSPRLKRNIALAMLDVPANAPGTEVTIVTPTGPRAATVTTIPFL